MRRGISIAALLAVAALGACAKNSPRTMGVRSADAAAPPGAADGAAMAEDDSMAYEAAPEADVAGMDELADLETKLAQNEAVLVESGVALDEALAAPAAEVGGDALQMSQGATTKCERICKIADAVCDLETRICEMGERHPATRGTRRPVSGPRATANEPAAPATDAHELSGPSGIERRR